MVKISLKIPGSESSSGSASKSNGLFAYETSFTPPESFMRICRLLELSEKYILKKIYSEFYIPCTMVEIHSKFLDTDPDPGDFQNLIF